MPLGSRADEMVDVGGIGPGDAPAVEVAVDDVAADGSEETLFDDGEVRDYDLGEGD